MFAQILRQRGVEPDAVRDVQAAWDAFGEFLQIEIEGTEGPKNDGDGFIVQWGRWDWNTDQMVPVPHPCPIGRGTAGSRGVERAPHNATTNDRIA
jgi:hypothetical protein